MMAFDIKTGAEEAQRKFDEKNLERMTKGPEEVTKPDEIMKIEEEYLDDAKEKEIQDKFTTSDEMLIIEEDL
jgi:hypothetical protein